jgi:hypothetical protein
MPDIAPKTATVKPDLAALAATIREHHGAAAAAAGNMLDHAIAAGEALAAANSLVPHGEWSTWLRRCEINERTARRYMQIYNARNEIRAKRSRTTVLSIAGVLKLLGNKDRGNSGSSRNLGFKQPNHVLSSLAWSDATSAQRTKFLSDVGIDNIIAALPVIERPEFRDRARARGTSLDEKMGKLLRIALAGDSVTPEVVTALRTVRNMVLATGNDPNEIVGLRFDKAKTVYRKACAESREDDAVA